MATLVNESGKECICEKSQLGLMLAAGWKVKGEEVSEVKKEFVVLNDDEFKALPKAAKEKYLADKELAGA